MILKKKGNIMRSLTTVFVILLALVFCIVPYNTVLAADGEVITTQLLNSGKGSLIVKVVWTAAGAGTKANLVFRTSTSCTGDLDCPAILDAVKKGGYYLYAVRTLPGGTAPAALYDITIIDTDSTDIMGGKLANRSATVSEYETAPGSPQPQFLDLTITWANVTNANATGTIYLFFAVYE